jgi:hypothetical protein
MQRGAVLGGDGYPFVVLPSSGRRVRSDRRATATAMAPASTARPMSWPPMRRGSSGRVADAVVMSACLRGPPALAGPEPGLGEGETVGNSPDAPGGEAVAAGSGGSPPPGEVSVAGSGGSVPRAPGTVPSPVGLGDGRGAAAITIVAEPCAGTACCFARALAVSLIRPLAAADL